jgi:hypothetical protein
LIHQRHPTPSCGGYSLPRREPWTWQGCLKESLTANPELENSQGHSRRVDPFCRASALPPIGTILVGWNTTRLLIARPSSLPSTPPRGHLTRRFRAHSTVGVRVAGAVPVRLRRPSLWPGTSRECMRSASAERSPSAALEPRRGCPKIPPLRAIAAMFFGEIYDSIRGRIECRQKIKSSPSPTRC